MTTAAAPQAPPAPQAREIAAFLDVFMQPGSTYEARITDTKEGPAHLYSTVSGYFDYDHRADLVTAIAGGVVRGAFGHPISGEDAIAVYITTNPVKDVHVARAMNRLKKKAKATSKDGDVVRRRHFFIDLDPTYDAGMSATDDEVAQALERRDAVLTYLYRVHGWGAATVVGTSGNGGMVLFNIDLPNDAASTALVQRALAALHRRFSDEFVLLDPAVYNAARLCKLVGTVAAKGDHFVGHQTLPDRPWRLAQAVYPDNPATITSAQLAALGAEIPEDDVRGAGKRTGGGRSPHSATGRRGAAPPTRPWTVDDLARHNGFRVEARPWGDIGIKYLLDRCLSSDDHPDGAALFETEDGWVSYRCHHARCADCGWAYLVEQGRVDLPVTGSRPPKDNGITFERLHVKRDGMGGGGNGANGTNGASDRDAGEDQKPDEEEEEGKHAPPDFDLATHKALYGPAGAVVRLWEPFTEAHPLGILESVLNAFGNAVGRKPHVVMGAKRHGTNLFSMLVGLTSEGRKGTAQTIAEDIMGRSAPQWLAACKHKGLASGEGVIWMLRDPKSHMAMLDGTFVDVVDDAGVTDKRLLVVEEEFAGILKVMAKEGSILSTTLRVAWDGDTLENNSKRSPERATEPHFSLIGHITPKELRRRFKEDEAANGFGNRFCWLWVQRYKEIAQEGQRPDETDYARLCATITHSGQRAAEHGGLLRRDGAADVWWQERYHDLTISRLGLFGALTERRAQQIMRRALLYALLDEADAICFPHLEAAYALWEYAEASTRYLFGIATGDTSADRMLRQIRRAAGRGMNRTEISAIFDRHLPALQLTAALNLLQEMGLVRVSVRYVGPKKHPSYIYIATEHWPEQDGNAS